MNGRRNERDCLVPAFNGAIFSRNGRKLYGPNTSRQRHDHARSPSSITAIASFGCGESRSYGINPKTVLKWRKRATVEDLKTGPKAPRSTVLSEEEEAIIIAFRRHTLLALDDCLYALQPTIPHLTRSSLHRCLQRHGISRLPHVEGDKPSRKKFKAYAIGYFHIDLAQVQTAEGKLYLYVAIDRTSKFAFVQLVDRATTRTASDFLEALVAAVPYKIHTVLTDNGIQFADIPKNRNGPTARFRGLRSTEHAGDTASSIG